MGLLVITTDGEVDSLKSDRSGQSDLRALSAGVKDPEAIGFRRVPINDLD